MILRNFLILLIAGLSLEFAPQWEDYVIQRPKGYILTIQYGYIDSTRGLGALSNYLTTLDLNYNELILLGEIEFLTKLKVLKLMSNKIESIDDALKNLISLVELDLRYNQIKSINCIGFMSEMQYLLLTSNQIESIESMKHLTKLTWLEISYNKIESIDALENATQLTYIDARFNLINSVKALRKLIQLNQLYLRGNKIKSCHGIETMTKLFELDMSLNQLDDIVDSIKHLSLLRYLKMSFNRIEYINKSGVTRLIELRYFDLIENLISSFEIGSLHTFYRLESILLMNNNIGRLQSFTFYNSSTLRYINIENNMIEFVDEFAFFYLESLTLISLRNNRIKHIFNHAFDSIQGGTFSLNLNQNLNIQNISLSSMNSDLKCLYLSYESLSHLKDYTDDFFPFKVLDLSKSKMSTLYARTIKGMFSTLILSDNKLFSFEDNSFTYLPNLVEIDFTKNLIKSLDFHEAFAFSQLNMTRLVFNSNRIEHILPEFFLKFPALSHLDLSNNNFYSLTKRDFLNLLHLECLLLNDNQILSIEKKTFTHLSALRRLELKNNLIYDLFFLANLKGLNELVLSGNQIETFEYSFNLSLLDLSQNRLNSFETVDSIANNLKTLILNSNQIKKIDFFNFDRLEYLDMSYNGLTVVNFSSKSVLSHLNLNGNKIELIKYELIEVC
jgi:Leucine-rich repeat (LRR) protein